LKRKLFAGKVYKRAKYNIKEEDNVNNKRGEPEEKSFLPNNEGVTITI